MKERPYIWRSRRAEYRLGTKTSIAYKDKTISPYQAFVCITTNIADHNLTSDEWKNLQEETKKLAPTE